MRAFGSVWEHFRAAAAFTESPLSLSRDQRPLQPFLASLPCILNPMLDYLTHGDIRCIRCRPSRPSRP